MKKLLILILLVSALGLIPLVNAETVDISQTPQAISDALGIPLFASQLMLSVLFMSFFLFPTMLLTNKRQNQTIAVIFTGLGSLIVCVAIGWLPYWILLILSLLVALMYASKMKDVIGG